MGSLKGQTIRCKIQKTSLDEYVVDFICLSKKLIIELDGGYHDEPIQRINDSERDESLYQAGYTVLRISNKEVYWDIELVIAKIKEAIKSPLTLREPPHRGADT